MQTEELKPGHIYAIKIKDWMAPTEEVIPGQTKRRMFVGHKVIDQVPFIEVQRESGKLHLIAAETIEAIQPVDRFH